MILKYTKFQRLRQLHSARQADRARVCHIAGELPTFGVIRAFARADQVDALDAFTPNQTPQVDQAKPRQHRRQHRQQQEADEDAGDADPDPPITTRQLYDQLLTAINSDQFTFFATFRTPRPAPKASSYDPTTQEHLGNEIARSLADLGIACIVVGSFQSVNTQRRNPHFHALLSEPPPHTWEKSFKAEYGRRSVHVEEIGPKPQDAEKVAYYVARQGVSLSVSSASFTRSASIDDGKGDCVIVLSTGELVTPVTLAVNPSQSIPPEGGKTLRLVRARPPPRRSDNDTEPHRA